MPTRPTHHRLAAATAVASVVAFAVAPLAAASSWTPAAPAVVLAEPADDSWMVAAINDLRADQGAGPLSVDSHISNVASNWTDEMAASSTLKHNPNLASDVNQRDWAKLGENVGRTSGTVQDLFDAFVASPGHYRNLVDPDFDWVGIVSKRVDGTLWMTQVFMKLRSSAPPPTTAPPPPPPTTPPPTSSGTTPPPTTTNTTAPPATTTTTTTPDVGPFSGDLPEDERARQFRVWLRSVRFLESS